MKNDTVPLFEDFETYVGTLPTRRHRVTAKHYKLCDYPFWAKDEDVDYMVKLLEDNDDDDDDVVDDPARAFVKYAAAPTSSGKTASALVGFLASAEKGKEGTSFTHYLYLPFANNNRTIFGIADTTKLSRNEIIANEQGAAFALECLKRRLIDAEPGQKKIDLDGDPALLADTAADVKSLLDEFFPEDARIFIHLDEHREMCLISSMEDECVAFRRGFMELLAGAANVTVFATYTKLPGEIPATASSGTCRDPVPVPGLDVDKFIETFLRWPTDVGLFDGKQERLWATLKFRLAAKLTKAGLLGVHLSSDRFVKFCKAFEKAAAGAKLDVSGALEKCIKLCALKSFGQADPAPYAIDLLLGIDDYKAGNLENQIRDVVVVRTADPNVNKLTSSLGRLLSINDKNSPVYSDGRDQLDTVLTGATDYLSATPLEASYAWALSCKSARDEFLKFTKLSPRFKIECERLNRGRFFKGQDDTDYDVQQLKKNVIYYVDEPPTHPRADIFFRTEDDDVVLIDVYGGGRSKTLNDKNRTLTDWIAREQPDQDQVTFHGVVLAPFVNGESNTTGAVTVVRGEDALGLLGGLRQVSRWLGT